MQAIETLKVVGQVKLELTKANGAKEVVDIRNLVVTTGLNYIVSRMKDTTLAAMSHMAIGSGSTPAALGDTALGTELGRVALASTVVSANTVQYTATFPAGTGTGTVYEAGVLNNSTGGTLLCRTVFGIVTKEAGDTLAIVWTITVS